MQFKDFISQGKVVVGEKDLQKAKALAKMSERTFKSAQLLKLNNITASTILATAYESLRQVLEAICLQEGYKVYSHEAFTYYLKELREENLAEQFDRFRKLRNGVNYYGKPVSAIIASDARKKIAKLNTLLKEKYLKC